MHFRFSLFFLAFILLVLFSSKHLLAAEESIVIQEVQITGGTGHSDDDFIELYNPTSKQIDVAGWKIKKRIKSGTESTIKDLKVAQNEHIYIPSHGYLLWAHSGGAFASETPFASTTSLTNDNSIGVFNEKDVLIDALTYGSGQNSPYMPSVLFPTNPGSNVSLERENDGYILQPEPSPKNDAVVSEEAPQAEPDEDVSSPRGDVPVRINELFPDPKDKGETEEFIELFNYGEEYIDLSLFSLEDNSKSSGYTFPEGTTIAPLEYRVVKRGVTKISLNNSEEKISLYSAGKELIDSVSYEETKEGLSYSFDGEVFRWTRELTPGSENILGVAPQISKTRIPKVAYEDVAVNFGAGGPSSHKYTWDFGDGSKSRKQRTEHVYKETGEYLGNLIVDDGAEETHLPFSLKVKSFPKYRVSIISFLPNPKGDDALGETITLRNKENETLDLKGWKIATGATEKKLTAHIINDSFLIKGGKEKILGRDYASFSLPNREGVVELRQPNDKTIQKIRYKKEGDIPEGAVYQKGKEKAWEWFQEQSEEEGIDTEEAVNTRREITLDDLSSEELSFLEQKVEERVREKILAEIEGKKGVMGASTETEEAVNIVDFHSPSLYFFKINEKLNTMFSALRQKE